LITVWRIGYCENPAPAESALRVTLGLGATLGNGRWHTQGLQQVVYGASTRSLAQLEKRVHANGSNPKNQALMRLELPKGATLLDVNSLGLPATWRSDEAATQRIGMNWLSGVSCLGLWVPSFVEPEEMNLLINPVHPQYQKVKVTIERNPFTFDPRLF